MKKSICFVKSLKSHFNVLLRYAYVRFETFASHIELFDQPAKVVFHQPVNQPFHATVSRTVIILWFLMSFCSECINANCFLAAGLLFLPFLCLALGLQNGTMSSSLGRSVRVTHLKGLTTDLTASSYVCSCCSTRLQD